MSSNETMTIEIRGSVICTGLPKDLLECLEERILHKLSGLEIRNREEDEEAEKEFGDMADTLIKIEEKLG